MATITNRKNARGKASCAAQVRIKRAGRVSCRKRKPSRNEVLDALQDVIGRGGGELSISPIIVQ